MAAIISRIFFPFDSEYSSLLLATATFGVGFVMRPIGGVVLGAYADRRGRKPTLQWVIGIMTVAIAMIAFAPTYETVGVAASVIVIVARLLQGFATGGEFASATAFLIESAPPDRRGFYGSWQMAGQGLAVLSGAVVGAGMTRWLDSETVESWGWRIPFLFGLLLFPVGLYIRRHVSETREFLSSLEARDRHRPAVASTGLAKRIVTCTGIVAAGTISFFVVILYLPTFATRQLGMSLGDAFVAQSIGLALMVVAIPAFGALSDRIGRRPVLVGSLVVYLAALHPLYAWIIAAPTFANLVVMQLVLCGILGAYFGPFSTVLGEQFPAASRSIGLALSYNLGVLLFGGFAQFFVTWLSHVSGSAMAPAYYVLFGTAIGLVAAIFVTDAARRPRPAELALSQCREAA
ncbi:MFS transporter [Rhodoplanes sp. SY1]|uniref:MFS transporter n=1 Tax=Rhodoplanes sp. SY1 TaxID=3166646 RepID=UPI0038B4350D